MDTAELRTFLIVAELGAFSRAAVRLGIPQPTLSRHIARLEDELGSRLFYRHGRGISLTDTGEQLRQSAQPLVRQLDALRNGLAAQSEALAGTLRFGITPVIGQGLAASVVAAFRARAPDVQLHVVEAFGGTLSTWLDEGWVDVAILYQDVQAPAPAPGCVVLLKEAQFLISLPHSAPSNGPVLLKEIDPQNLVLYSRGAGRRAIEAAFDAASVPLRVPLAVDSFATIKRLVEQNGMQSILPIGTVYREVEHGLMAASPLESTADMAMLLVAKTPVCKPVTAPARLLIQILQDRIAQLVANGQLPGSDPDYRPPLG